MPRVSVFHPAYFTRFRCKCADCRAVCCRGWRITLSEAEYFRALGQSCSDALRRRMDVAFYPVDHPDAEEYAYISPDRDGCCSLRDPDGLCALQRECGEDVLPAVCRLYPRSIKPGAVTEASCSGSCERTVELLMEEPFPLPFVTTELETRAAIPADAPADAATQRKMRDALAVFQSGANAHDGFLRLANALGVPLPAAWGMAPYLREARQLLLHFGVHSVTLCDESEAALDKLALRDGVTDVSIARYAEAEARLRADLPEAERWFANILANHLFYERFPAPAPAVSPRDALYALGAVYILLRFFCVVFHDPARARARFADEAAAVLRFVEHTDFYTRDARRTHADAASLDTPLPSVL